MARTRLLAALLAAATSTAPAARAADYRDVPRQHWAFAEVDWARRAGAMPSMDGSDFRGQQALGRYEMATFLAGHMHRYYRKRDQIDAELRRLREVGSEHERQLLEIETRGRQLAARMEGAPAPGPEAEAEARVESEAPAPLATRTESLRERLARLRAKVATRGGETEDAAEDPTAEAAPPVDPAAAERIWDAF